MSSSLSEQLVGGNLQMGSTSGSPAIAVRPQPGGVNILGLLNGTAPTTMSYAAGTIYFSPFTVPQSTTINNLGFFLTAIAAGGSCNIGIYSNDPNAVGDQPLNLLAIITQSTAAAGLFTVSVGSPIMLAQNTLYWLGIVVTVTAVLGARTVASSQPVAYILAGHTLTSTLTLAGTSLPVPFSGTVAFGAGSALPPLVYYS